jgi:hypothetical protein
VNRPLPQNRPEPKPRKPSLLPTWLEKTLSAYAMAAGSAGVALLASVHPAEARIVFTKTDIVVPIDGGVVQFDINGDGQNDFGLSQTFFVDGIAKTCSGTSPRARRRKSGGCPTSAGALRVIPAQGANEVWQSGVSFGYNCAADLFGGQRIGPLRPFAAGSMLMVRSESGFDTCRWKGAHPAKPYLGVKFLDGSGKVHFGWVRVAVNSLTGAVIQGYAYETSPNTPILAGETSGADAEASRLNPSTGLSTRTLEAASLGRLAQGAAGFAWRREEEVVAN